MRPAPALVLSLLALLTPPASAAEDPPPRWWKGNLHTHTLWSDGNDFPEMVASWYRDHGYHFLAISDHNVTLQGQRWMPLTEIERRAGAAAIETYRERFGEAWVETRTNDAGETEVRLKPLDEVSALLEERDRFLMIPGEEITDSYRRLPVHLNATNLGEYIEPRHGESVREVMRNNLRAVEDQAERLGREILAHVNHPNFVWALTAEDLAHVVEDRFFEVFNGHTGVHNLGDETLASTEEIWDVANTLRIAELGRPPLYGLAVDDAHHYHDRSDVARTGRGWIMVRARRLTPESIIRALERGDFYASTGVTLDEITFDEKTGTLTLAIQPEGDATFTTRFLGTREGWDRASEPRVDEQREAILTTRRYSDDVGEVFATVQGTNPSYTLRGDELYVRAVVESSKTPEMATAENTNEKAWTQPVGWRTRLASDDALRAMTFNIRYDNPNDGPHAWEHRKERVVDLIERHDPDLLGLQEVMASQLEYLEENLAAYTFRGVGRTDGRRRGEFSPVAYRTDRFDEIDRGTWWHSDTPDVPSKGWDAALPRIATWVRLRDRRTDENLLVVSTHFDHRGETARANSASLLAAKLRDEPRVILMGDFNATPGSVPHDTLTAIFTDAAETAGDRDPSPTWTGWDGEPDPGRRIDWILLRGFRASDHTVPSWDDPARPESDHLPVIVTVDPDE